MSSFLSFGLETFDLSTVDPIPRRRVVVPAAKAKPVNKVAAPVARVPESAPTLVPVPIATAAEIVALQSELATLRAELQAIKDAPMIEERRQTLARWWIAGIGR
jgi:hypothetical protein